MKFRQVNIDNAREIIPRWVGDYVQIARAADEMLSKFPAAAKADPLLPVRFTLAFDASRGTAQLRTPDEADPDFMGALIIEGPGWTFDLQINYILRSYASIAGQHCVYSHGLLTDVPVGYIGITKRPWHVRFAEHEAAARGGSRFLFHDALRRHASAKRHHRIFAAGLSLDHALELEELLVSKCSLYPIGLNMIPGGRAGLRYLSSLSLHLKSTENAAETIAGEMEKESLAGRPNPLCSARWESDPDYVARVICGHSGRLTVEQVQMIRAMHVAQRDPEDITALSGAKGVSQVKRLLASKTYARIK